MIGANYAMYRETFKETEYRLVLKLKALFELMHSKVILESKIINGIENCSVAIGEMVECSVGEVSINLEEPFDALTKAAIYEIITATFTADLMSLKYYIADIEFNSLNFKSPAVRMRIICYKK